MKAKIGIDPYASSKWPYTKMAAATITKLATSAINIYYQINAKK